MTEQDIDYRRIKRNWADHGLELNVSLISYFFIDLKPQGDGKGRLGSISCNIIPLGDTSAEGYALQIAVEEGKFPPPSLQIQGVGITLTEEENLEGKPLEERQWGVTNEHGRLELQMTINDVKELKGKALRLDWSDQIEMRAYPFDLHIFESLSVPGLHEFI